MVTFLEDEAFWFVLSLIAKEMTVPAGRFAFHEYESPRRFLNHPRAVPSERIHRVYGAWPPCQVMTVDAHCTGVSGAQDVMARSCAETGDIVAGDSASTNARNAQYGESDREAGKMRTEFACDLARQDSTWAVMPAGRVSRALNGRVYTYALMVASTVCIK